MDEKYLIKRKSKNSIFEWIKKNSTFLIEIFIGLCLGIGTLINSCYQNSLLKDQTTFINTQTNLMQKQTILIERQIQNSYLFDSLQSYYTKKQADLADIQMYNNMQDNIRKSQIDIKDIGQDIEEINNLFETMLNQIRSDIENHPPDQSWEQSFFGLKLTKIENILQKYFTTNLIFKKTDNFKQWMQYYSQIRDINRIIGSRYTVEQLKRVYPVIEDLKLSFINFCKNLKPL